MLLLVALSSAAQDIIVDDPFVGLTPVEKEALRIKQLLSMETKMGISVNVPDNLYPITKQVPAPCRSSALDYLFVNADSSLLITIALMPKDSLEYEQDVLYYSRFLSYRDYRPDRAWENNLKAIGDSTHFKPIFYSGQKLKAYNADVAVEFMKRECETLYLDKYKCTRAIILYRKYRGMLEIHYFVSDKKGVDASPYIRNGAQMISFYEK